ncbi:MAG: acyltransferase family protein [Clostridia bacterium]|nr:acyltransferase family protein [Clostridia bacterium]
MEKKNINQRAVTAAQAQRNPSMDIIRILAFSLVVSVHFFLQSKFYTLELAGPRLFVMTVVRSFCLICVPLFMILSGFLLKNKTLSGKYYKGINKTLVTYFLASVACYIFWVTYFNEPYGLTDFLGELLNFRAAKYSWYIEMYIGLFLLIPFLNLAWNNIEEKKYKKILIFTMLFLTALPQIINIFNFTKEGWWASPDISDSYSQIIPSWWTAIYPVTYYFIGCYLREYGIKINKIVNVILIAVTTLLFGAFCFYRSAGGKLIRGKWQDYGALPVVVIAVLVFAFIANLDLTSWPQWLKKFCNKVSDLCLGAYLLSNIFDKLFYGILNEKVPDIAGRFNYFIIVVPACIVCSLLLSFVVNILTGWILKLYDKLCESVKGIAKKSKAA